MLSFNFRYLLQNVMLNNISGKCLQFHIDKILDLRQGKHT